MEALAVLKRAGLPFGPWQPNAAPVDWQQVVAAAKQLYRDRTQASEREALALVAWLSALQTHFATQAEQLGLNMPLSRPVDGRWIKLRRIAIDRLALLL